MFIGHFGVALAAKRASPRTSLGALFAATQLADLLWPSFLLLGWEHATVLSSNTGFGGVVFTSYPITHSLVGALAWSLAFGALYQGVTHNRRGAVVVAILVFSHWVLDFIVHQPDLPLYPGGPRVGLALWNSVPGTLVVESVISLAGLWIYLRTTRARDRIGRWAFWSLMVALGFLYTTSIYAAPPPSERALAYFALTGWLVPLWAWWADAHRTVQEPAP